MEVKKIFLLLFFLTILSLLHLNLGAVSLNFNDFITWIKYEIKITSESIASTNYQHTIYLLRLRRLAAAIPAGGGLAISGSVLQRLLNNPLADPFILGISAGGATGAAIVVVFGIGGIFGQWYRFGGSLMGCSLGLIALTAIYIKIHKHNHQSNTAISLTGMIINTFCSAILMFTVAMANPNKTSEIFLWLQGNFAEISKIEILTLWFVTFICCIFLAKLNKPLNVIAFGDENAMAFGFCPLSVRIKILSVIGLLISVIVSTVGSIGFIGLIVPHFASTLKPKTTLSHMIFSFILGSCLAVFADVSGRFFTAPQELPPGVFTALIGAPLLIAMLISQNKRHKI